LTFFAQQTKPEYPDSPEGLEMLMGDLVSAAKTNSVRESQLIDSLRLPDAPSWFDEVFGSENGVKLAASYQKSEVEFKTYAKDLFVYCANEEVNEILIDRLDTPGHAIFSDKVVTSMFHPVPLYRVSFRNHGSERATSESYVYVKGGFRRLPDDVLLALSGMPLMRMRFAEDAYPPKVQVKPKVPSDAEGRPRHGKVILWVMVDTNGHVKDVKLRRGDPVLGEAAAEAVRQWQFKPMTVSGNPVEVETLISVRFP
jgi:TonB family protein